MILSPNNFKDFLLTELRYFFHKEFTIYTKIQLLRNRHVFD
jgi:hypothetical protein